MNTNIAAAMTPQGIDGYIAFYEGVRIDLQTHKADEGIDAAGKLELTQEHV